MRVKKPCYTCKESFVKSKRDFLLQQKIEDVKELAKKDNYTGLYLIYQRDNGTGFEAVKESERKKRKAPESSIYFDNGIAF